MNPAAELLFHTGATLIRVMVSVAIALSASLPLGILLGRNLFMDRLFRPLVYLLYTVPKISLFPLALLLFGLNDRARISIVSLVLFFQFLIAFRDGVKALPPPYFLVMESLGARRLDRLLYLLIPALLPRFFTALRIGTAAALSVLFFTETSAVEEFGLGRMTMDAWMSLDYGKMALAVGMTVLTGLLFFSVFRRLEKRFCRF